MECEHRPPGLHNETGCGDSGTCLQNGRGDRRQKTEDGNHREHRTQVRLGARAWPLWRNALASFRQAAKLGSVGLAGVTTVPSLSETKT